MKVSDTIPCFLLMSLCLWLSVVDMRGPVTTVCINLESKSPGLCLQFVPVEAFNFVGRALN